MSVNLQNFPPAAGYKCPKHYKIAKILLCSPPQAENFGGLAFSQKFPPLFFDISKQGGEFLRGIHVIGKTLVMNVTVSA